MGPVNAAAREPGAGEGTGGAAFRFLSVVLVSAYLAVVGLLLMATLRVPSMGLFRILHARLRGPYRGTLGSIAHEQGHCYVAPVPKWVLSDLGGWSRLVVLEDGKALPHGHAPHDEIRRLGGGRYSHWAAQVYFSSSDNTDPGANGRTYTVEERRS